MLYFFSSQSDCQIHLKPQLVPPNMEQYMGALLSAVQPSLLNKFRIYISLLQMMDYSISEDVTKVRESVAGIRILKVVLNP